MKMTMFDDLNYPYSIEALYPGESGVMINKASFFSIFRKFIALFFYALKQLNPFSKKINIPEGIQTVIVVCSLNQYRTLEKLIDNVSDVLVISVFPIKCKNNILVDTRGNCWVSILNIPRLLFNMLRRKGFNYQAMIFFFDDYLNAPGVYSDALKYLDIIKPKSVLVANDHIFFPRSYFRAAQKLGIKTIYAQHASVSNLFPRLEYDYAFLDGDETLNKYTSNGKESLSDVLLSGSPRFDKIPLTPKYDTYELGIAINILDNKERILDLVNLLILNNINFIIRPHPGQPDIDFWKQYCKENQIGYSNPFEESPIDFIASCKIFAVGDSGIHLEIALCKKLSYYVNFQNNDISDGYDFIKDGLVDVRSNEDLVNIVLNEKNESKSFEKIKYFVANFETEYWGKSAFLIAETINQINSGQELSHWKKRLGEFKIFEINN